MHCKGICTTLKFATFNSAGQNMLHPWNIKQEFWLNQYEHLGDDSLEMMRDGNIAVSRAEREKNDDFDLQLEVILYMLRKRKPVQKYGPPCNKL
jgi:hypothetical protein